MNRGAFYKSVFTNPLAIRALLWSKLPLAAFAGLRVARLDETGAEVTLPAGWMLTSLDSPAVITLDAEGRVTLRFTNIRNDNLAVTIHAKKR